MRLILLFSLLLSISKNLCYSQERLTLSQLISFTKLRSSEDFTNEIIKKYKFKPPEILDPITEKPLDILIPFDSLYNGDKLEFRRDYLLSSNRGFTTKLLFHVTDNHLNIVHNTTSDIVGISYPTELTKEAEIIGFKTTKIDTIIQGSDYSTYQILENKEFAIEIILNGRGRTDIYGKYIKGSEMRSNIPFEYQITLSRRK